MKTITQQTLTGERALFKGKNISVTGSVFADGESPLKESRNIEVDESIFKWKYPLWYSKNASVHNSMLGNDARAGIWYTSNVTVTNTTIEAPKTFRRSSGITLNHVNMPNASETLWMCRGVEMEDVNAKGDYFAMNTHDIHITNFQLAGNYSFDGCRNVTMDNAKLLSKDAFWNCENVTVTNSFISGEYIGWNSKNLTFVNCTIESLQGFCYIENLTLKNCRLLNTNLAFEYCSGVNADITTDIVSVKNPISGIIRAAGIGEVIFDDPDIDPRKTNIIVGEVQHAV